MERLLAPNPSAQQQGEMLHYPAPEHTESLHAWKSPHQICWMPSVSWNCCQLELWTLTTLKTTSFSKHLTVPQTKS